MNSKSTFVLQDWELYGVPNSDRKYLKGKVYGISELGNCADADGVSLVEGDNIKTGYIIRLIDEETFETESAIFKVGKKSQAYELYLGGY